MSVHRWGVWGYPVAVGQIPAGEPPEVEGAGVGPDGWEDLPQGVALGDAVCGEPPGDGGVGPGRLEAVGGEERVFVGGGGWGEALGLDYPDGYVGTAGDMGDRSPAAVVGEDKGAWADVLYGYVAVFGEDGGVVCEAGESGYEDVVVRDVGVGGRADVGEDVLFTFVVVVRVGLPGVRVDLAGPDAGASLGFEAEAEAAYAGEDVHEGVVLGGWGIGSIGENGHGDCALRGECAGVGGEWRERA